MMEVGPSLEIKGRSFLNVALEAKVMEGSAGSVVKTSASVRSSRVSTDGPGAPAGRGR